MTPRRQPRKRINAHVLVNGNDFFIFGGKVDADKVEVTLDDVWTLDLSKLVEYTCVQQVRRGEGGAEEFAICGSGPRGF